LHALIVLRTAAARRPSVETKRETGNWKLETGNSLDIPFCRVADNRQLEQFALVGLEHQDQPENS
jgi:hypothetical protein